MTYVGVSSSVLMSRLSYWWPIWDPSDRFQSIEIINITLSPTSLSPFQVFNKKVIKWKVNVLYISSSSELVCLASFETISGSNAFHWTSSTGIEIVFRSFRFSLSLSSRFRRSGSTWPYDSALAMILWTNKQIKNIQSFRRNFGCEVKKVRCKQCYHRMCFLWEEFIPSWLVFFD